jgi:uncharacterized membrane protein YvlD (DUF360 family)
MHREVAAGRRERPGWFRTVARALVIWVINAFALWLSAQILPGIDLESGGALGGALVIALVNALLWPVLARLVLPISALTLGLASLVLSGFTIWVAGQIIPEFRVESIWWGLALAFVMTVVNVVITSVLGIDDDDAYWRNVVRRTARRRDAVAPTDVPGVLFLEIDGLAYEVLRRALRNGHTPTMARWIAEQDHHLIRWECDWSSQTGASQAGLLHGTNEDMPAFRWYEKERQATVTSNRPQDTALIQRRISSGRGLLFADGVSRANMFSGDAPHALLTLSMVLQRGRGKVGHDYFAYFSNPYNMIRTIVLTVEDVAREWWQALGNRRRGVIPRVHRGGLYPLMRAWTTVIQRDLAVQSLLYDIFAGRPVGYSTFVGYDEIAHHSGIERPETLRALGQLDRQFARLERAAKDAPRPYRFVVLSDHGQTDGLCFRQSYGETLEQLVRRLSAGGASVDGLTAGDEGWGLLSASVTEAASGDGIGAKTLDRVTRGRRQDGAVDLGPQAEERRRDGEEAAGDDEDDILVMASGCLGLVYLTREPGRVSLERLQEIHPGLVEGLRTHPGIGFLLVRSEAEGSLVLGPRGRVHVASGQVDGEDPLAPYGENALRHVRRTDGFPHVADLMINAAYDPELGMVPAFEEFVGSHGGMGGSQSFPFALVPPDLTAPAEPVIGAEHMHRVMRGWLASVGQEAYRDDDAAVGARTGA